MAEKIRLRFSKYGEQSPEKTIKDLIDLVEQLNQIIARLETRIKTLEDAP